MQASVSTDQGTTTFRSRTPPSTQRSRLGSDRTLPPPPENAPLRDMYVRYWFLKTWLPAERKAYKWEGEVPWSGWGSQRILDSHPGLGNAKGVMSSKSKEFTSLCLSFLLCKVRIIFLSSVQFSHLVVSGSFWPHGLQHARLPCPSPTPRACSNSCPLSRWCHPTISSSVVPFSCHLQPFPASRSFPLSQFFASGGQSIGVSASTSLLPKNI